MAHGNASDLIALGLIIAAAQLTWLSSTLFEDVGPLKAAFSKPSPDLLILFKFAAGLLLSIGLMFSGVKWNPANGIMGGAACLITSLVTAYNAFKAGSDTFVPSFLYVYSVIFLLGCLHLNTPLLGAKNPVVKNLDPNTTNNHGNGSDKAFFLLFGASMLCFFYPEHLYTAYGPFKATFSARTTDLDTMVRFTACLMLCVGFMLSGVKWNPVNGKMGGFGCLVCAGSTAYNRFTADAGVFVPHLFYVYSAIMLGAGLNMMFFPSNAVVPKVPDMKTK